MDKPRSRMNWRTSFSGREGAVDRHTLRSGGLEQAAELRGRAFKQAKNFIYVERRECALPGAAARTGGEQKKPRSLQGKSESGALNGFGAGGRN